MQIFNTLHTCNTLLCDRGFVHAIDNAMCIAARNSLRFSSNSEAYASYLLDNLEDVSGCSLLPMHVPKL